MLCKHGELPTAEERYEVMKTGANIGSGTPASRVPTPISVAPSPLKVSMATK